MPASRQELLTALPFDRYQQAYVSAREWLKCIGGGLNVTRAVSRTNKSVVWEVMSRGNSRFFLKRHLRRDNFDIELLTLEGLEHTHRAPNVIAFDPDLLLILMTALKPLPTSMGFSQRCAALVEAVAAVHGGFLYSQELRLKLLPTLTLTRVAEENSRFSDLFRSHDCHLHFSERKRSVFGGEHVSFALFDIKLCHLMHNAGSAALVDFDASAPGLYEEYDLITLARILAPHGWSMEMIADHYSEYRNKLGGWTSSDLTLDLVDVFNACLA